MPGAPAFAALLLDLETQRRTEQRERDAERRVPDAVPDADRREADARVAQGSSWLHSWQR